MLAVSIFFNRCQKSGPTPRLKLSLLCWHGTLVSLCRACSLADMDTHTLPSVNVLPGRFLICFYQSAAGMCTFDL